MKARRPINVAGGLAKARRGLARPRQEPGIRVSRGLGAPALLAVGLIALGASLLFALGVVAGDALALTPLAFLAAGLFFVITVMTYAEGNSLHPERGGASSLARHAFNELVSFVAGWAILLDYLIVMAIAALAVPHYLAAFWSDAGDPGFEFLFAAVTLGWVAWSNVRGVSADRLGFILRLGLVNIGLAVAIIVAGSLTVFDLSLITDAVDLGASPKLDDLLFALVVACVVVTGVEAASGLAGEVRVEEGGLRRLVVLAAALALVVLVGVSLIALMAVPVVGGTTELGGRFLDAPLLGVVSAYEPEWLREALRYAVGGIGALVLAQAAHGNMLGLSRLTYALTTNRQVPSAVGKLHPTRSTPYVAIAIATAVALVLALSADVEFLAGIFAFGAMIAIAIAHASVLVLRFRQPSTPRLFRVPLSVPVGGGSVPLPAALGLVAALAGWVSVVALHEGARLAGTVWMVAGIVLYVVYRRTQGKSLTQRFVIPATVLRDVPDVEYGSILVPVFGRPLDDDIVGTAGRLAAEDGERGEGGTVIEAVHVVEVPMSLPLDARVPDERVKAGRRALARAKAVGEEYAGVEVATAMIRARTVGTGIVAEARRRGVEAIVLAAEDPTAVRGGALLGGRGGPRDRFVGDVTRYVVEKAPCRVILTAPPSEPGLGDEDPPA